MASFLSQMVVRHRAGVRILPAFGNTSRSVRWLHPILTLLLTPWATKALLLVSLSDINRTPPCSSAVLHGVPGHASLIVCLSSLHTGMREEPTPPCPCIAAILSSLTLLPTTHNEVPSNTSPYILDPVKWQETAFLALRRGSKREDDGRDKEHERYRRNCPKCETAEPRPPGWRNTLPCVCRRSPGTLVDYMASLTSCKGRS